MSLRTMALLAIPTLQGLSSHAQANPVPHEAPILTRLGEALGSEVRSNSARQGWLLRSNAALGFARADGVPTSNSEHGQLAGYRFATTNHVSIGYGWRPNWALTIDGFRAVIPHRPHPGQKPEFEMRVDTETLGIAVGSTLFIVPLAMHIGASVGFAMSRIGGDLFTAPTHSGLGSLSFVGFELMRSQGIGVVLSAQLLGVVAHQDEALLATQIYALSLGVTYW